MAKEFKLQGENSTEKFNHLEQILPRIYRKMNPNVTVITPPSVISSYIKETNNLLFKCVLFAGKIVSLNFNIGAAIRDDKKAEIDIKCTIIGKTTEQSINIRTKRLSSGAQINLDVFDGDLLLVVNNNSDVVFHDIAISLLFVAEYTETKTELIEDFYEGI